jgi:hypothetical protein
VFHLENFRFHPDKGNFHDEYNRAFTEGDMDILLLGSSRILSATDSSLFQKHLNLKTSQLGFTQSNLSYSYDLLKAYLNESIQNPKYIILDISWFSFDTKRLSYKPYAAYFVYRNPKLFLEELITNKKNHLKSGFITLGRSVERITKKQINHSNVKARKQPQDSMVKSYFFERNQLNFLKTFPAGKSELEMDEIESLQKIITLCKKKNINLIFLTTPEDQTFSLNQVNRNQVYDTINKYVSNRPWLDYSLNGLYYQKSLENILSDSHHVYFEKTFTRILIQDLKRLILISN